MPEITWDDHTEVEQKEDKVEEEREGGRRKERHKRWMVI